LEETEAKKDDKSDDYNNLKDALTEQYGEDFLNKLQAQIVSNKKNK